MPTDPGPPQKQALAEEAKICFAVATACLLIGLSGSVINRISELRTPLSALTIVGAFYGLMGLVRWLESKRNPPSDKNPPFGNPSH